MIEFQSVSKTYPGGSLAVADFSLIIESHHTVVLVGSSGSGKTTLLRMINRMVEPSSGRVLIDGHDVLQRDPVKLRRRIGYVLQDGGLLPHRNIIDNIATVAVLNGTSWRQARQKALGLLEQVGLDSTLARRYPAQLSGGQQQRVGVARALIADPNILLMDEPFGAVDPITRRELQDELLGWQAQLGKTIVFVTHDVDEAFRLADEVVVLRAHAEIARSGSPAAILADPGSGFVHTFIGADQAARVLKVKQVAGRSVAIDRLGRPVGVLE